MRSLTSQPEQLCRNFPCAVQSTRVLEDVYGLYPAERQLVANANPKRRAEFCAGRHCARQALEKIGKGFNPILADIHGCPVWPAGVVGSISHTNRYAIAVVAHSTNISAIGVDIESWRASPTCWKSIAKICSPAEQAWVNSFSANDQHLPAHIAFSIREAVYKCVYSAAGIKLGFDQLSVDIVQPENSFRAQIDSTQLQTRLCGVFGFNNEYVFSAVWIPAAAK